MSLNRIFLALFFIVFSLNISPIMAQQSSAPSLMNSPKTYIKPPYLKAGDTVAIVAPSGVLRNKYDVIERARELFKSWGLQTVVGPNVFNQNGHFAGTDDERAADFQWALDDPKIKAIWCARGGYGTVRMIDKLDYAKFKLQPKWVIGYSDITAIHNQIHNLGYESMHAMMCVSLPNDETTIAETISTFKDAIFGKQLSYTLKGSNYNKPGMVTAPITGGNLTLLHTMLGSETSIDASGEILFIEEIGEYAYHIDRMLQSLKRAGYFEHCKGILVGDMSKVRKNPTPFGQTIEEIILELVAEYDFPVAFNMPAGHEKDNRAMILGSTVTLKVEKSGSTLIFNE
ncbi:S66 peptidase family protein [Formosa algae]|uniref:S66 peptidase family protein n=1 Tax=Formosa algae TaxID=225843 RepID=UPI000CD12949|nr:LD-carboxypeptidase [Formosa algae]